MTPVRVVLVEDEEDHAELVLAVLRSAGMAVSSERVETAEDLAAALDDPPDLVIVDCSMPRFTGPEGIEMVKARGLDVPCVVVSATVGEETAVEMMRAGAADYVMKSNLSRLPVVVERELREARERAGRREVEAAYSGLTDRLSGLLRAAGDLAVMGADRDGVLTDFSEGAERMLGYRAADVVGRADLALPLASEELEARAAALGTAPGVEALLRNARRGAESAEWTFVRRDGTSLPVAQTISPIVDDAGQVTGFVAMARDITARRLHEREQEALRHVATTVAAEPEPELIFALVAEEAARLLGGDGAGVLRFAAGGAVKQGAWAREGVAVPPLGREILLDGRTAVAMVHRTGECARVDDMHEALDERDLGAWGGLPAVRSIIACPVRAAGRVWGALWVGATSPGVFGGEDERRLARFGDLVGLAIANAEARERIVSETVAGVFRGDLDLAQTLELITSAACRALGADRVTCYVMDEDGERIAEVHTTETAPDRLGYIRRAVGRRPRDLPLARLLAQQVEPILVVEDAPAEPAVPEPVAKAMGLGAFVGVRLEHPSVQSAAGPELLGSLFVSYPRPRPFSSRDRSVVEGLAGMAAVGLATTRLQAATMRTAAEAEALAMTDPLTGLANHRAFQERLAQEVTRARRHRRSLSLALIDIDHFRRVNEEHGHEAGDQVLVELARRLQGLARDTDVIARVGGEEMAWLMPETEAIAAWQAVDRAREAVARTPLPAVGRLTVSAGVCDIAQAGTAGELLRLAEGALYWAKQHGRDVAFLYSPEVVEVLSAEERAERLQRFQSLQSIKVLARAVDAKDHSTRQHSERVAELATAIADAMGWEPERLMRLREAGLVHDVGKIGVPDRVLFKPARLTPGEYEEIIQHAAIGAEMVADVLTPEQVAWVRGHHERWDGRGYPDGVAAEEIPDGALVLALADAWDVMTSERTYHEPLGTDDALAEIRRCSGGQFSPAVVEAMERLVATGAQRAVSD
jgi:diguanylate cyclase (GGDEF)-like protein/PAS domain S-box-containing protein/putative nucleotidyltransferase with HDIG domain